MKKTQSLYGGLGHICVDMAECQQKTTTVQLCFCKQQWQCVTHEPEEAGAGKH